MVISVKSNKVHQKKYIAWLNCLASSLRICLIFSFSLDYQMQSLFKDVFSDFQIVVLIIYLLNWILSILIGYVFLLTKFITYLMIQANFMNCNQQSKPICKKSQKNNPIFVPKSHKPIFKRKTKCITADYAHRKVVISPKKDSIKI